MNVAWGVLPDPPSCQADVSHHEGNRERPRARRLQLVSSQTVAPSLTCNRFAALDDHVDVPRPSESGSLFAGGADVVHIGTPRVQSSSEVRRTEHENEAMGTPIDDPASDSSDTESVGSGSSCSAQPDGGEVAPTLPIDEVSISAEFATSLSRLDTLDLEEVFHLRALLMKSPPFLKGAYRSAIRLALGELDSTRDSNDPTRSIRAWKLFLLLPRLLLFRPPRGGLVPKGRLRERFERFARGEWESLLTESQEHASRGSQASRRRRRREHDDDVARRAGRAEVCVQAGELSSARQCLEGAPVAPVPGNWNTLLALRDPSKRPAEPRDPIPADVLEFQPGSPLELDVDGFSRNIRCAKRGVAGGPSGMTADHLRPILESETDTAAMGRMATDLARADIPLPILTALRMGRLIALQKPTGGVRGIVTGEVFRRLVARSIAQQLACAVEVATSPFQYALSTKAGGECVAHAIQTLTDLDSRATVLSIDGIGAFDLISRGAMLDGLLQSVEGGDAALPFVRQFYGTPSHISVGG